jgi:phosphinothricin acetyltransferase
VAACVRIYNHYVENSVATFDTQPMIGAAAKRWFASHQNAQHPLLVADQAGKILGYGSLSSWSTKAAYSHTSEVSVFVSGDHHRKGTGAALLDELLRASGQVGHRCLIARIEAENRPSIELFRSRRFYSVGVMHDAGHKFGRWLNVEIMERLIKPEQ